MTTKTVVVGAVAVAVSVGLVRAPAVHAGTITGTITVTEADGKSASGAEIVVYVTGFSEPSVAKPGVATATLAQKGRAFRPDVVAVTAGESVDFPNGDGFVHNVFSQSAARKFDLGSFKKGESKVKDFATVGVVDVYCNIHPEMAATVLVLPNPRHTRAQANGTYSIDGVPPGTWTVFAYTRRVAKPASAKVTVGAAGTVTVDLALARGAEPAHLNKYGEKYRSSGTYR